MLSLWLPQQSRGWGLLRVARCTDTSQTPLHPAPGHLDAPHALVLYHWPCTDGVFGAFGAYLYHKRTQRPVAFVPNAVTAPPRVQDLPITKDTHTVYLVDYVGPPGFVQDLATAHPHVHVVVLDHHKTAVALLVEPYQHLDKHQQLPTNVEVHLDMERSGATLSWDYFAHKLEQERNLEAGKGGLALAGGSAVLLGRLQRMFRYVEDSDLWRWSDLDSGSFVSGLSDLHLNYHANANRGIFEQLCALDPDHLISVGAESRKIRDARVTILANQACVVHLGGPDSGMGSCLGCILPPQDSGLRSLLGNMLALKSKECGLRSIGVVAYEDPSLAEGLIKVSLRSVGEEDDTTVISEKFQGGGHKKASSCSIPLQDFKNLWWTATQPASP